jgi:hypothetical protein
MAIIEYELTINAPPSDVYKSSQDYSVRYQWDPFPERIEFLDGATEVGIGVRTLVLAKSGLTMEVEFVQVAPPTTAAIIMIKGPADSSSKCNTVGFNERGWNAAGC